jgi:hypothetical protein
VTPGSILAKAGRITLAQKNIFGFVHNSSEVLQQIRLCCGALQAPEPLHPFLNIRPVWKAPPPAPLEHFHEMFRDTDVFIVEVSSIRIIRFESYFLQIHRTRELLTAGGRGTEWWQQLVRKGSNDFALIDPALTEPLEREIAAGLVSTEQTTEEAYAELVEIAQLLRKPVLFVATFNCDYQRRPVPQRSVLQAALRRAADLPGCALFDPTEAVLERGIPDAMIDLGHYREAFEPEIAELIMARLGPLAPAVQDG